MSSYHLGAKIQMWHFVLHFKIQAQSIFGFLIRTPLFFSCRNGNDEASLVQVDNNWNIWHIICVWTHRLFPLDKLYPQKFVIKVFRDKDGNLTLIQAAFHDFNDFLFLCDFLKLLYYQDKLISSIVGFLIRTPSALKSGK